MIKYANDQTIHEAATIIRNGGLVAFPTETVYGLGADATNATAVAKIYAAKKRPQFNPLIVHVPDIAMAQSIGVLNDRAMTLAQTIWPGPLTIIVKRRTDDDALTLPDITTAGLNTVALRMPTHPVARSLLQSCGVPIAAPSANPSGCTSATTAHHVADAFGDAVPFILAGGRADIGLESTVLDLSGDKAVILRHGAVMIDDLSPLISNVTMHVVPKDNNVTSPGQLTKHYATQTSIRLNAVDVKDGEALLAFGPIKFMGHETLGGVTNMPASLYRNLSRDGDLYEAAANLFAYMRELDTAKASSIAVMRIPNTGLGLAINDRLQRAAVRD